MRIFCWLIALLLTGFCHGQELLTEIFVPNSMPTKRIHAKLFGDSLLLVQPEYQKISATWISKEGITRNFQLPGVGRKLLVHVEAGTDGFSRYYFLEPDRKAVLIKCLLINEKLDSIYWQKETFEMPGVFLGSFNRQGLNIISAAHNGHVLCVTQLDGLKLKNEKSFGISNALSKSEEQPVAVFRDDMPVTPNDALASTKIVLKDSLLMIITDDEYNPGGGTHAVLKTTIYQFNLDTGSSKNQFFPLNFSGPFRSMVFRNRLYRIINGVEPILQVFDLNTAEIIHSQNLSHLVNDRNLFAYYVDEERHTIEKIRIKKMISHLNYVMVESVDSEVIVRIGDRRGVGPAVPILSQYGIVGLLASAAANMVLLSTLGEPSLDSFIYLKESPSTGFSFSTDSPVTSQRISNHDVADAETGVKYRIRMHVPAKGFAYGLYMGRMAENIEVRIFR